MKFPYEVGVESNDGTGTVILRAAARAIADEIAIAAARQGIPASFTGPERNDGSEPDVVRYERGDPTLTDEVADEAVWKGQAARARLAAHEMRVRGSAIPAILDRLAEMRALSQNPHFHEDVTAVWRDVTGLVFNAVAPIDTVRYGIDFREDADDIVRAAAESWGVPVPRLLYCAGCGAYHGENEHADEGRTGGLAEMLAALTQQFDLEAADDSAAA